MSKNFKYPSKTETFMLLSTGERKVILVEADSDKRYYSYFLDRINYNVVRAGDRGKVCDIIDSFITEYPNRIEGICDRDLLSFGIGEHLRENIYHTDYHDLEMDAIKSNNLEAQLVMKFSPGKMDDKNLDVKQIFSIVFKMTEIFGCFRLVNEQKEYGLKFRNFNLKRGVDYNSNFEIDIKTSVTTIINQSGGGEILKKADLITKEVEDEINKKHDLYQISNGHDFVYFLREFLKVFGTRTPAKVLSLEDLTDMLLGTYKSNDFLKSNLGKTLESKGLLKKCL